MAPTLETIPLEILESIIEHLCLPEIRKLRLVSQTLALKAVQRHFKSYFHKKHIDMTESSLREFTHMTKSDKLGCELQSVVLVGIVNNTRGMVDGYFDSGDDVQTETKEDADARIMGCIRTLEARKAAYTSMHEAGVDVALLVEAFTNLKNHAQPNRLASLTLDVVVYRSPETRLPPSKGGNWRLIWQVAADTFHTTMRALSGSALAIEKLDIYNDTERCSIACNELSRVEYKGLTASFATLTSISISFSDRDIDRYELFEINGERELNREQRCRKYVESKLRRADDPKHHVRFEPGSLVFCKPKGWEAFRAEAEQETNFSGLPDLLQLVSGQLESLKLHFYVLDERLGERVENRQRDRFLERIIGNVVFPKLTQCTLSAICATEMTLLAFLRHIPSTRDLRLQHINLEAGTFRRILVHCLSEAAGLDRLSLLILREDDKDMLVQFGNGPFDWFLVRVGVGEVRRPFWYTYFRGRSSCTLAKTPRFRCRCGPP